MSSRSSRSRDRGVAAAVVGLALAVYVRSLLPGIGYSGDTAKWQFLGRVGGVPHASGYPLYQLVNKAFVNLVPWGSLAWRANLLSAVLGAVAVALLYLLLRALEVSWLVAAAVALCFGVTRTFWTQAVVAEVYTLHLALMLMVLVCLARWRLQPERSAWWLLGGLTLYLLSFGNHLGAVLLLPGVVWIVWSDWRRAVSWRNGLWLAGVALVSASQYLYVLRMARVGAYVEHPLDDAGEVLNYLTGGQYKQQMFDFGPGELLTDRLWLGTRSLLEEYFVLLPIAAYGFWLALRPGEEDTAEGTRAIVVGLVMWALGAWIFAVNFDVADVVVSFLPTFLVVAVFLAIGLDRVVALAQRRWATDRRVLAGLTAGLVLLPVAAGLVDYRRASQRGTVLDDERIQLALDTAGQRAVLLTDSYHDSEYLWYFLLGEDMAASRQLAMAHMVTPDEVAEYFDGKDGPVRRAAAKVAGHSDNTEPRYPPLYTASARQAEALQAAGLQVTELQPDVWRVDARPQAAQASHGESPLRAPAPAV